MTSRVTHLNVNDGIADRDEMGVCVESLEDAMDLWSPFEQFIYRSAAAHEGRDNARSTAGDLDLTIYSLRKWMRLALKGNPTILLLLFTPEDQLVHCDSLGSELRALTPVIISRRVQGPFLGYLQAHKQRLTGERGQKRIHRPELEEMYGLDTKYAMHMLRFGFHGDPQITLGDSPCPDVDRSCAPVRLPQCREHLRHGFRKDLGVAAIVMRQIHGIDFGRTRAQVKRVAKISRRNRHGLKSKPTRRILYGLLIEGLKRVDQLFVGVSQIALCDQCTIRVQVPESLWRRAPKMTFDTGPIRVEEALLVCLSVSDIRRRRMIAPPPGVPFVDRESRE